MRSAGNGLPAWSGRRISGRSAKGNAYAGYASAGSSIGGTTSTLAASG